MAQFCLTTGASLLGPSGFCSTAEPSLSLAFPCSCFSSSFKSSSGPLTTVRHKAKIKGQKLRVAERESSLGFILWEKQHSHGRCQTTFVRAQSTQRHTHLVTTVQGPSQKSTMPYRCMESQHRDAEPTKQGSHVLPGQQIVTGCHQLSAWPTPLPHHSCSPPSLLLSLSDYLP